MATKDTPPASRTSNWESLAPGGRPTVLDWLRAWRAVIREPDKRLPSPPVPPEGVPIPEGLGLHCPECDYDLTGLREWRCPECGERFSLYRVYTQRLMRSPEFFLRYRYSPAELRSVLWSVLMFAATLFLITMAEGTSAIFFGILVLGSFATIILPNMLLLRWQGGISWPRLFFWTCLLLLLAVIALVGLP